MKPKLFLLQPGFPDEKISPVGQVYYCPHCVFLEGVLAYYPKLNEELDVERVPFARPRQKIVAVLGEEHQFCPSLILLKSDVAGSMPEGFQSTQDHYFTNDENVIARYLAERYGIGLPHP